MQTQPMTAPNVISGERIFKPTISICVLIGLLIFVPIAIAWAVADDPTPAANVGLAWITLGAAAVAVAICIVIRKTALIINEQGLKRETIFGIEEILWSQVKETRCVDKPVRMGAHFGLIGMIVASALKSSAQSNLVLTVISDQGVRLKVTSNFQQAKDAANMILAKVMPPMLAASRSRIKRGEAVRFGPVTLTATDLAWKSEPGVGLGELESAEISGSQLKIKRIGKWRTFVNVRSDKIPDVFVLLELLDEMAPQLKQRLDPLARLRG